MSQVDEKKKAVLDNTIKNLEKNYGKGIVMRMGDKVREKVPVIPTGSIALDHALGVFGFPRGRVIEVYGPESSGKTTLTLHAVAEAQKMGGICAFIDAEHALDINYAEKIGVDVENLYVSQPSDGEQALEIVDELVSSHAFDIVVVDSVAALVPRSEIEGNMGDAQMAMQARLMSQALRKLTGSVSKTGTSIFFINQLRMKIGVFFGNPEVTTGGNALKFYASMRLDIRKIETLKKGDEILGSRVKVKVVKNKLAPPFKQAIFDIFFGEGISRVSEILELAVEHKIVQKAGSWYSFDDERIGQGAENVRQFLKENTDIFENIETKVKKEMGILSDEAKVNQTAVPKKEAVKKPEPKGPKNEELLFQ